MYDGGKIGAGIVLFVALAGFPFWYSFAQTPADRDGDGTPDYTAVPRLPEDKDQQGCIESTEYMRSSHMQMLNEWRDDVVRVGEDVYVAHKDQREWDKSLSRTCMSCHTERRAFCQECHTYLGVEPECWNCHVEPELDQQAKTTASPQGRK